MDSYVSTRIVRVPQYGAIKGIGIKDVSPFRLNALLGKAIALTSRSRIDSLSALGNVGVFQLNPGLLLNIVPRFKTRNLTYMVDSCNGSWVNVLEGMSHEYVVGRNASQWLTDVIKTQFVKKCSVLQMTGLLREYRRHSLVTSSPFGRLDIRGSIALRGRGVYGKLKCSYEERTIDVPANSCLLLALENSSIPQHPIHERNRKKVLELFRDVSHRPRQECLSNRYLDGFSVLPENWKDYHELLDMAWLILTGRALELEDLPLRGKRLPSLCIDFQHLFEEFVRTSLRNHFHDGYDILDGNTSAGKVPLYQHSGTKEKNDCAKRLRVPQSITADCDVLIRDQKTGRVLIAAECKCTMLDSHGIAPRGEVEQSVVYAVRFGLPFALVIHPVTDPIDSGMRTPGRIGGVFVYQYNVNIDAKSIDDEMVAMADSLQKLLDISIEDGFQIDSDAI